MNLCHFLHAQNFSHRGFNLHRRCFETKREQKIHGKNIDKDFLGSVKREIFSIEPVLCSNASVFE